jgi:exodeoxyribonuclease V alpha subunit
MELKGQIEEFIYQNESNSYSIAVFTTEEQEVVTVVGYLPFISVGDTLKLQGKMVVHQEYGEQFKIETFEKLMPESAAALEKYLASGTIKGIGPATAKKIIDKFGEETLTVFKFEPIRLAEIKGISKDKAYEIGE